VKFVVFFLLLSISAISFAEDKVINDSLEIMQFLLDNPVAQQNPLAIQLSRGELVKVTSIKYTQCTQGSNSTMSIVTANAAGKVIASTNGIFIPCPK